MNSILAQKAKVWVRAEIAEVRQYLANLAVREPKPARERTRVLVDRSGGNQTARSHIICLVCSNDGVLTVDVLPGHRATNNKMMTAPSMVSAVAVAGERPAEVRRSESRHLILHAGGDHEPVKVLKCRTELCEQPRMLRSLAIMGVKATELHVEDLPLHAQAAPSTDDPGNRLQGRRQRVVCQLVRHRVEILRRIRNSRRARRD